MRPILSGKPNTLGVRSDAADLLPDLQRVAPSGTHTTSSEESTAPMI
jgi:hypothetical protein